MEDLTRQFESHSEFARLVELVCSQNPLQRKRISAFISGQDAEYWSFAEALSRALNHSFLRNSQDCTAATRSYNEMCMEILRDQIKFRKTGVYRIASAEEAERAVYSRPQIMRHYVVGLLLSYLFWPNHYRLFKFFKDHIPSRLSGPCLEIGAGHALFSAEVLKTFPLAEICIIDISQASLDLARDLLAAFGLEKSNLRFIHADYLAAPLEDEKYDFVVMGEVLEHVNAAPEFLRKAQRILAANGSIFLSTCANCPAKDHVYHFHTVGEIRQLIREAGLAITEDQALAAEDIPESRWIEELATINYFAVLVNSSGRSLDHGRA